MTNQKEKICIIIAFERREMFEDKENIEYTLIKLMEHNVTHIFFKTLNKYSLFLIKIIELIKLKYPYLSDIKCKALKKISASFDEYINFADYEEYCEKYFLCQFLPANYIP